MTTKCARWQSYFVPLTYVSQKRLTRQIQKKYCWALFANEQSKHAIFNLRVAPLNEPPPSLDGTWHAIVVDHLVISWFRPNANKLICERAATFATRTIPIDPGHLINHNHSRYCRNQFRCDIHNSRSYVGILYLNQIYFISKHFIANLRACNLWISIANAF